MADLVRVILHGADPASALGPGVRNYLGTIEPRSRHAITNDVLRSIAGTRPYGGAVYTYLGRPSLSRLRRRGVPLIGGPHEYAAY
jgi:hypothetical protein